MKPLPVVAICALFLVAGGIWFSVLYDNTSYDNTSYDNTRYDNTRYDNTRYDNTRYDNTLEETIHPCQEMAEMSLELYVFISKIDFKTMTRAEAGEFLELHGDNMRNKLAVLEQKKQQYDCGNNPSELYTDEFIEKLTQMHDDGSLDVMLYGR